MLPLIAITWREAAWPLRWKITTVVTEGGGFIESTAANHSRSSPRSAASPMPEKQGKKPVATRAHHCWWLDASGHCRERKKLMRTFMCGLAEDCSRLSRRTVAALCTADGEGGGCPTVEGRDAMVRMIGTVRDVAVVDVETATGDDGYGGRSPVEDGCGEGARSSAAAGKLCALPSGELRAAMVWERKAELSQRQGRGTGAVPAVMLIVTDLPSPWHLSLPLRSSGNISNGDYGGDEELHTPFSPSRLLVPIFSKHGGYGQ
nr:hypothetical protein Iba_chr05cCG10430 [Ipomoea batatas]